MRRYRIVEEIDGTGKSLFYPEKKGVFGWGRYYLDCWCVEYDTKEGALLFLKQRLPKLTVIHDPELNDK